MSDFYVREPYFTTDQYVLEGVLDVKSWTSVNGSFFGRNSIKKIRNRMHSWCKAYCVLDVKTSCFKYYKIKRDSYQRSIPPDLETMTPKISVMINESDVMDIQAVTHGKSHNFIINLTDRNQILLSADSEELKQKWMFTFQNMDDLRDDIVLSTVNSPRKVFALKKSKSSAPKSFRRMPSLDGQVSSIDIEDEEERQLAELAIACLKDSGDDDDDSTDEDIKARIEGYDSVDDSEVHQALDIETEDDFFKDI
mmetsp:Transcript_24790/g.41945  ORF Transcript_24790/g.41945 Transcript_24790/m.41945 type:complete len:252 (-) Transcript_24790:327-1082(-)